MIFPEKIKSIKVNDKVLDIGPGSAPFPRADVLLDKKFFGEDMSNAQRGYASQPKIYKPFVYYQGGALPFKDKAFDYVICSHVIEHIPIESLDFFISEIQRVGSRGYIEFPTVFYELINYQDVHIWLMNARDEQMLFLNKNKFQSNYIHKIYREMFYGRDTYLYQVFQRYKEVFFIGYEWEKEIKYRVVEGFNDLVNEDDLEKWQNFFTSSHFFGKNRIGEIHGRLRNKIFGILHRLSRKKV